MSLMNRISRSREWRLMIVGLAVCVVLLSLLTFRHLCPPPVRPVDRAALTKEERYFSYQISYSRGKSDFSESFLAPNSDLSKGSQEALQEAGFLQAVQRIQERASEQGISLPEGFEAEVNVFLVAR